MCEDQRSCHGSQQDSRCCREQGGSGHGRMPESWDRERKIEFYRHRIECFGEQIEEARQNLAQIENDAST